MVVSVDLAYKRFADIGVATLEQQANGTVCCTFISLGQGAPTLEILAERIDRICADRAAKVMLLDGPQAGSHPAMVLSTRASASGSSTRRRKTGEPGVVKPANYARFVTFSVAVYDALTRLGWHRFDAAPAVPGNRLLIESFPPSAWRSLGLAPLPAKRKTRSGEVVAKLSAG